MCWIPPKYRIIILTNELSGAGVVPGRKLAIQSITAKAEKLGYR